MKEGCLPLPGRGSRDLGVASLELNEAPDEGSLASSVTDSKESCLLVSVGFLVTSLFWRLGVARSLFCLNGALARSDF